MYLHLNIQDMASIEIQREVSSKIYGAHLTKLTTMPISYTTSSLIHSRVYEKETLFFLVVQWDQVLLFIWHLNAGLAPYF